MDKATIFTQLDGWIRSKVSFYCATYFADPEDLYDEAIETFMIAFDSFDESNYTKIETWIKIKIQYALLDFVRETAVHNKRYPKQTIDDLAIVSESKLGQLPSFDLRQFLSELSDDASTVAELIIAEMPSHRNCNQWRSFLNRSLQRMGWDTNRISEVFVEVAGAL